MSSSDGGNLGVESNKSARRRRRTFSDDEKERLVAESCKLGASVSGVAQRHAINANQLFTWRRQMRRPLAPESAMELIPVEIVGTPEGSPAMAAPTERRGAIEISLVGGARVHVDANVNEAALKRVLSALKATT